jgi:hypothetical protein
MGSFENIPARNGTWSATSSRASLLEEETWDVFGSGKRLLEARNNSRRL